MGTTKTCTHHFLSSALRWIRWNLGHMAGPDTRKAGKCSLYLSSHMPRENAKGVGYYQEEEWNWILGDKN